MVAEKTKYKKTNILEEVKKQREVQKPQVSGGFLIEKSERAGIIKATLLGDSIISNTIAAHTLYQSSRFGEIIDRKIKYSPYEALYLLEKSKLALTENKKNITFEKLLTKTIETDKKAQIKYTVFRDMRNRGYIVKTALKFGAEFRVYNKGVKPGEDHAKWILYPVSESSELTWHEFSAKNRVAHSTKKNLLIAIVDEENDVTYYEISWLKP